VRRLIAQKLIIYYQIQRFGDTIMNEKKYFVLMKDGNDTTQVFHSKQPRGAALKAASRGETEISLRERGTNRVHVFTGEKKMVAKPASAPDWLPDKINKANVKKVRIDRI
jgi:hypothetical protein